MELPTSTFGQENGDMLVESTVTTAPESRGPGPAAAVCSAFICTEGATGREHKPRADGEEKHHFLTNWALLQPGHTELLG